MLPDNIDLTENRDFGGRLIPVHGQSLGFISPDFDEYAYKISIDEYDYLLWKESIFGRKRHLTQKRKIFDDDSKYYRNLRGTCARCGRRIMPYNRYGLCRNCETDNRFKESEMKLDYSDIAKDDLFNSR